MFKPFTIEVTTEEQAFDLWHRLNVGDWRLAAYFDERFPFGKDKFYSLDVQEASWSLYEQIPDEIRAAYEDRAEL